MGILEHCCLVIACSQVCFVCFVSMYFNVDTPQPPIRQLATYFVVVWDQGPIQKKPEELVGLLPVESHLHTNQEDLTLSVL